VLGAGPGVFGNTVDTGCRQAYYEFYISGFNQGQTYRPKVQVLDNWGWCSGRCTTAPYSGFSYGCYDDGDLEDCEVFDLPPRNPWIDYNGRVIVK